MKQRILVVAENTDLRATLARWLIAAGYSVELAESAKRAREVLRNEKIELAIVAPHRPNGDNLSREIRDSVQRLILITQRMGDENKSTGTAVRADGYIAEPLREEDVLARVSAALPTQTEIAEEPPELLRFAGYTLDVSARRCFHAGNGVIALTRAEFSLLVCLVSRPRQVVSRDDLTRAVAGREAERGDRSVDMLISRLRRKIEADRKSPQFILTVSGVGYMFAPNPQISPFLESGSRVRAQFIKTDAVADRYMTTTEIASQRPCGTTLVAKALASIARLTRVFNRTKHAVDNRYVR